MDFSLYVSYFLFLLNDNRLWIFHILLFLRYFLAAVFVCHYVENHVVCGTHGIFSEACKVLDGAVNIFVNDTFSLRYVTSLHGKHGRQDGSRYA